MAQLHKGQLGKLIKRRRKELGLTQRELADRIPVKESQTVSRWERGERGPQDLDALAKALETTTATILRELGQVRQEARDDEHAQLDRIEAALGDTASAAALADLAQRLQAIERQLQAEQKRRKRPAADGPAASHG